MIEQLKEWVKENYMPEVCDWTEENAFSDFYAGHAKGVCQSAYEIGKILGMELEEPKNN